jgi:hypothetical protein
LMLLIVAISDHEPPCIQACGGCASSLTIATDRVQLRFLKFFTATFHHPHAAPANRNHSLLLRDLLVVSRGWGL